MIFTPMLKSTNPTTSEELGKAVKPILEQTDFTRGAWTVLRFRGLDSDASEIEIQIEV